MKSSSLTAHGDVNDVFLHHAASDTFHDDYIPSHHVTVLYLLSCSSFVYVLTHLLTVLNHHRP